MREDLRKTLKYVGVLLAISAVLIIVLAIALHKTSTEIAENAQTAETNMVGNTVEGVAGMKIGGPFVLIKQDGTIMSDRTYSGKFRLMFFGFTYCPDICPTELGTLSRVLEALSPEQKKQLSTIFITVDPERDTVDQMKQYMSLFHPEIDGLTGRKEEIARVLSAYKIYAQKVQTPEMSEYTMDHTANLYLFDPYDKLITIFKSGATDEEILDVLQKVL